MTPEEMHVISKSMDAAKDYADTIVKGPLAQLGELLSERMGYWRLKNRVDCLLKAKKLCEAKGIDAAKILPNVFIPLLDAAGDTDDPTLADMFASLLANNLDPAKQNDVHPAFAKVVSQLAPIDAKILEIFDQMNRKASESRHVVYATVSTSWVSKQVSLKWPATLLHLENLERLGLIRWQGDAVEHPRIDQSGIVEVIDQPNWRMTQFGHRLLSACSTGDYWRDVVMATVGNHVYDFLNLTNEDLMNEPHDGIQRRRTKERKTPITPKKKQRPMK